MSIEIDITTPQRKDKTEKGKSGRVPPQKEIIEELEPYDKESPLYEGEDGWRRSREEDGDYQFNPEYGY